MKRHTPPFTLKDLKIEVTYSCGLSCVHCSSDASPSNSLEMTAEECLRILGEAAALGVKSVAFSGGEPLLWDPLPHSVRLAGDLGLEVSIYTSGVVQDFKDRAKLLYAAGASRFIFSLFGATPVSHERVTRKAGSFKGTLNAMRDAVHLGLITELHFVPMANNYGELRGVALLARKWGASKVSVLRLVPQGRAALVQHRALSRLQNLELRNHIEDLRRAGHEIRTGSPYNFLMLNDNPQCCAAIDRLIIAPDLKLYPCDAFKRVSAADLVRTEAFSCLKGTSLSACWDKSPYLSAVRVYLTTDFEAPCSSCHLLDRCLSGCLAQKTIASKTLVKCPDPDCVRPLRPGDTA